MASPTTTKSKIRCRPMDLHNKTASVYIPDSFSERQAFARTTHLGIGAHQDDLEFMAFHGILECYSTAHCWFGGVTCTNGAGSSRSGPYETFTDAQIAQIRHREQNTAAQIGNFGFMIQLDYPSCAVRDASNRSLKNDLRAVLDAARPEVVYTHNPVDKHDTHIAVAIAAIQAIREIPAELRPRKVIGCELWRSLDWLPDEEKVLMDVSGHDHLAAALTGVFDSQIAGGKRYDLAILGRRAANATFFDPKSTDKSKQVIFGLDLTPLVTDESINISSYISDILDRFKEDVRQKLSRQLPQS